MPAKAGMTRINIIMKTTNVQDKWHQLSTFIQPISSHDACHFKNIFYKRLLTENLLVFLLQYAGLTLSTLSSNDFPVWFATGSSCAFIFLRGYSILPGVWLGSLLAYILLKINFWVSCGCATIFTMQAFILFWGSCRFIKPTLLFVAVSTYLKFIVYCSLITGFAAYFLQVACHSLLNAHSSTFQLWLHWWTANLNGVLILSFPLIALDAYFPQISEFQRMNKLKIFLNFGLLLMVILALLMSQKLLTISLFSVVIFLLVAQISARYQWSGAMLAVFLLGFLLSLGALLGSPLFLVIGMQNILLMKFYLALTAILAAILAITRITI